MQKVRCHPIFIRLQPFVSFSFQVLFHSLSQGSFHISLAVLVHYRSKSRFRRSRMVPRFFTNFTPRTFYTIFFLLLRDFHPLWYPFPIEFRFLFLIVSYLSIDATFLSFRFHVPRVRSPLLTRSRLIFFPQATKMFQFAWFFLFEGFPCLDTYGSPLSSP